jgi:hypothetical protein
MQDGWAAPALVARHLECVWSIAVTVLREVCTVSLHVIYLRDYSACICAALLR